MLHYRILPKARLVLSLLMVLVFGYLFEEHVDASSDNCTLKNVKGGFGATFSGAILGGAIRRAVRCRRSSVAAGEPAKLKEHRVSTGRSYR